MLCHINYHGGKSSFPEAHIELRQSPNPCYENKSLKILNIKKGINSISYDELKPNMHWLDYNYQAQLCVKIN